MNAGIGSETIVIFWLAIDSFANNKINQRLYGCFEKYYQVVEPEASYSCLLISTVVLGLYYKKTKTIFLIKKNQYCMNKLWEINLRTNITKIRIFLG